ncbi:MAG: MT-A70 family methyltransferase [Pirellulales bacterium]
MPVHSVVSNGPREETAALSPPATVRCLDELLAEGHVFPTIYADPPWTYRNRSSRAAAANHYATLSLQDICDLPVRQLATKDSHLHLWATTPLLQETLTVMRAWGFEYKSCFVWVKDKLGMGNYWRVSHELLLFGIRGSLPFRDCSVRSWLQCRRTIHSRKPESIRMLVERVSPAPYLELFGRAEVREMNWTVFGNEVERRLF